MTIQPAVNLALFLTLPAMLSATTRDTNEQKRGFDLFRVLLLMLVFGDAILAAAPNIAIVTIGNSNLSATVHCADWWLIEFQGSQYLPLETEFGLHCL
jgi:hypothetical protein